VTAHVVFDEGRRIVRRIVVAHDIRNRSAQVVFHLVSVRSIKGPPECICRRAKIRRQRLEHFQEGCGVHCLLKVALASELQSSNQKRPDFLMIVRITARLRRRLIDIKRLEVW
jgi:hypothetical protein